MKSRIFYKLCLFCLCGISFLLQSANTTKDVISGAGEMLKPRIIVLTDIAPADNEPDDNESVVRLLSHADLFEIEAIITCSGWNNSGRLYDESWTQYLHNVIDAYEKDVPNLMKRSGQSSFRSLSDEDKCQEIGYWPSSQYLRCRHKMGSLGLGLDLLGKDNVSKGSEFIIELAEQPDLRPLWILVWGGGNTVAQALWQLNETGDSLRLNKVLDKIRIYTITDQDVDWGRRGQYDISSHKWMRNTFGDKLFFIWDESAWLSQNEIGALNWKEYESKIQSKGNLGKVYPKYKWGVEGDTPSFLYVLPNGLHNPEKPSQGSWGGYFEYGLSNDSTSSCFSNFNDPVKTVSRKYEEYFYPAIFNNFAARMEWAANGIGNRNPEVIVNGQTGLNPIVMEVSPGECIRLDASESNDPDGDDIEFKWWFMEEAGDMIGKDITLDCNGGVATVCIPKDYKGEEIHIICECTDNGNIPLTSYRRIILKQ